MEQLLAFLSKELILLVRDQASVLELDSKESWKFDSCFVPHRHAPHTS